MERGSFRGPNWPTYGLVTGAGLIDLGKHLGSRCADLKSLIAGNALAEARGAAGAATDPDEGWRRGGNRDRQCRRAAEYDHGRLRPT